VLVEEKIRKILSQKGEQNERENSCTFFMLQKNTDEGNALHIFSPASTLHHFRLIFYSFLKKKRINKKSFQSFLASVLLQFRKKVKVFRKRNFSANNFPLICIGWKKAEAVKQLESLLLANNNVSINYELIW
jgi:hypothetical protein